MRTVRRATITAIAIVLVLAMPAMAGSQRPMRGAFTAVAVPADQRCGTDALTIGFEITGVATHLGALTGAGTNCTEFTLATDEVGVWDGEAVLTASDGSTIRTAYEGIQHAPVAGQAAFLNVHVVVGGTGRFADASGTWVVEGILDFLTGTIDGSVSGWLDY